MFVLYDVRKRLEMKLMLKVQIERTNRGYRRITLALLTTNSELILERENIVNPVVNVHT